MNALKKALDVKKGAEVKLQKLGADMRAAHEAKKNTYYGRRTTIKEGAKALGAALKNAKPFSLQEPKP